MRFVRFVRPRTFVRNILKRKICSKEIEFNGTLFCSATRLRLPQYNFCRTTTCATTMESFPFTPDSGPYRFSSPHLTPMHIVYTFCTALGKIQIIDTASSSIKLKYLTRRRHPISFPFKIFVNLDDAWKLSAIGLEVIFRYLKDLRNVFEVDKQWAITPMFLWIPNHSIYFS